MTGRNNEDKLNDEARVLLIYSKGSQTRRSILQTLKRSLKNCNQIARELNIDWWTVQRHLIKLEKVGLIKNIDFGHIRFYKVTSNGELTLKFLFEKHSE